MTAFKPGDRVRLTNIEGCTDVPGLGEYYTIISVDSHAVWPVDAVNDVTREMGSFNPDELELAE